MGGEAIRMNKLSFEEAYNDNFSYIYNFLYAHTLHRELAEDLTSQTFLKAYEHYNSYDPERSSVRTWLCRIARNLMIDHFRANPASRQVALEDAEELIHTDEYQILKDSTNREVYRLLSLLDPDERELISLRYFSDMAVSDIAETLGITLNAASKRIRRILAKLYSFLETDSINDLLD